MIYFIRNETNKAIKIGFSTKDPIVRLAQLQTGSPDRLTLLGVIPGRLEDEKFLHARFGTCRLGGEWFYPTVDLVAWIEWLLSRRERPVIKPSETTAAASVSRTALNGTRLIEGDQVLHPEYGMGRVAAIDGEGSATKARVVFKIGNARTFVVSNSPLKKCNYVT
jgi:hypothetical protein